MQIGGCSTQRAKLILAVGIAVYVLFFFYMAHLKLVSLTRHSGDVAGITGGFWYSLHGRFFYMYQLKMSWFGDKCGWLLALILPLYWLVPDPHTLIFVSCALIGLSVLPVYLLAVHALRDRTAGLLFAGAYLMFPTIVSQTVNQIGMLQFVIALVALALYFLQTEQFLPYLGTCALALLLGTEDVGLTLAVFLPYALLKRRGLKWVVPPIAFTIVWYAVLFIVVRPAFSGGRPYRPLGYLANLGSSPREILHTLLLEPGKTVDALVNGQNFLFVILLLQPLLWLSPWCASEVLFAVPYLCLNLLSNNVSMKNLAVHYNVTVGLFLCVATIFSVRKWIKRLRRRWGDGRYAVGFGALYLSLAVTCWPLWLNLSDYTVRPYYQSQRAAMALVPPGKSVVAPETMIAFFSDRERWATLNGLFLYTHEDLFSFDYLILDGNDHALEPWITQEFVSKVATHPGYKLIFNQQNVFVFRRLAS